MVSILENDELKIAVKHHGAELSSLVKKSTSTEYIWQADPNYWGRHAPILFPIVGRLQNDEFLVGADKYTMKQHGLARNMNFELIKSNKSSLTFELVSSENTLKNYPYPFRLHLQYILEEQIVKVVYKVFNPAEKSLYFSIGGHPAFNCPLNEGEKRSDYQLVFEQPETAATQRLDSGIRNGKKELILDKEKVLPLTATLFDEDALVFEKLASEKVSLQKGNTPIFTFNFKGFPYLGIWSKNRESPFVCIEPWFGVADHQSHNQQFRGKEGVMKLAGGAKFESVYTVEIH
ncbi:MAG: aldose 1-epimerase family protein [Saprospiraceae bacterium]